MANIQLKIYDSKDKKKVIKTYEAEGYDLMLGTVEDFMNIIDLDKINDNNEVAKMALKSYGQLKPLIMDIFPELTAEEYRGIKVPDLIRLIIQIGTSIVESLDFIKSSKN